jgi:L-aspartate oxidase
VVGSGVAGSATALIAAEKYKIPVSLVFAGSIPHDCNSYWAQGGIIYENYQHGDSPELLAQDIVRAGAGLCQEDAVMKLAREGPPRVEELLLSGFPYAQVPFDTTTTDKKEELSLCLEASHAVPRILHYADHTGKVITQHMTAAAANHPLITLVPDTLVTDLLTSDDGSTCLGVETLHRQTNQTSTLYASRGTVLCAGGLGGIYQHSTNPAGFNALGSSVALVERLATATTKRPTTKTALTQDLEYVQFHPTSLCIPHEARFLLTEALRGEGAILRNAEGYAFARDFHPDGELAPRDIVARGVFAESQKTTSTKTHNVFLDITHRDAEYLRQRFPTIQTHLQSRGLDLTHDHLPVIPAAHYTCGGISTDLQGRTGLTNLYAAGEAARTGLHGGNRLASTSLLEGLVYGAAVADYCGSSEGQDLHDHVQGLLLQQPQPHHDDVSSSPASSTSSPDAIVSHATTLLQTVRSVMWDHVGVVRTPLGIAKALEALESLQQESEHLYESYKCMETVGVRDAAFAGQAVARAALANPHSAGAHFIIQSDEDEKDDDDHHDAAVVDTTTVPRRRRMEDESDDSDSEDERTPVAAQ